jgi:hypothetical protein
VRERPDRPPVWSLITYPACPCLGAVADERRADGYALPLACDVAGAHGLSDVVKAASEELGRLGYWSTPAATDAPGAVADVSVEAWIAC